MDNKNILNELTKVTYEDLWDKKVSQMFSDWGKKGGATTKKKGKAYYKKIGKLGSDKRWKQ